MSDISKKNELISVILPVYNVEKYIKRCLNSVIKQTYTAMEIILVDDGSTDKSGKICDAYEELDSRIRVFHIKNSGLSEARNFGFNVSQGEYILYIDPDDFISDSFVERLYKSIIDKDVDFVQSKMELISFDRKKLRHSRVGTISENKVLTNEEYMQKVLNEEANISVAGKLFKRFVLETIKNPSGRLFEDVSVICSYVNICSKIFIENDALYFYNLYRQGSITSSLSQKWVRDYIWAQKKLVNDSVNCFEALHEDAIRMYRVSVIHMWSMMVRNISIKYLLFPFFNNTEMDYYIRYIKMSQKYIFRHLKDYMNMSLKRKIQAVMICFCPWPYIFCLKQRMFIF